MLIDSGPGNYTFIKGIGPFSAAVRAFPGFAIIHAALRPWLPLVLAYERIEQHLADCARPLQALCGMHLRIPQPLSRAGFEEFNRPYIDRLRAWGLEVDGANPVARTNVAPAINTIAEPMLAGFFYTTAARGRPPSWIISGVPEIASRDGGVARVVAPGDTSPAGLRHKIAAVLEILARHMTELHLDWVDATTVNLYTVRDLHPLVESTLLPALGPAAQRGLCWHHARPPVTGLELEIDGWAALRQESLVT